MRRTLTGLVFLFKISFYISTPPSRPIPSHLIPIYATHPVHPIIAPFTSIRPSVPPSVRPSVRWFACSSVHSFIGPFNRSFIHLSIHPSIHPFIHPSFNSSILFHLIPSHSSINLIWSSIHHASSPTSPSINWDDVIFNYSSRILSPGEKNLLAKRLKFFNSSQHTRLL